MLRTSEKLLGSAQESVSPCDFGGFCSFGKLVRRRSRCCGNVGTRVLCGFPSSEGNARTLQSVSRFSALGASFPQQALDFVAFRTGCICEPVIRLKCTPFRKPRRMRTSPDSCTEPTKQGSWLASGAVPCTVSAVSWGLWSVCGPALTIAWNLSMDTCQHIHTSCTVCVHQPRFVEISVQAGVAPKWVASPPDIHLGT